MYLKAIKATVARERERKKNKNSSVSKEREAKKIQGKREKDTKDDKY